MEIERTLFRIHERILSDSSSIKIMYFLSFLLSFISIYQIIVMIFANLIYSSNSYCPISLNHQAIHQIDIVNADFKLLASRNIEFLTLQPKDLVDLNCKFIKNQLSTSCYFSNEFTQFIMETTIGLENIVINDLVSQYNDQIYLKNNATNEYWGWSNSTLQSYKRDSFIMTRIIFSVGTLFKLALGIFLCTTIASIYIKMTIICAPLFIMSILECCFAMRNVNFQFRQIYNIFPWIGIYMNLLEANNRSKKHLLISFLLMLLLFYFIYLSSIFLGTFLLFNKSVPRDLNESYFGFIAMIEFLSLLFFRTRSTLYFLPKMLISYQFIYFIYLHYTIYAFYYLGYYIMMCTSLATIFIFIYLFEIPALDWNALSPFKPSLDKPRAYFLPVFSMTWITDIPQIWTMFYPLHGRPFFNQQNLAYVNQDYILLNNLMNPQDVELNVIDQPQPQQQEEENKEEEEQQPNELQQGLLNKQEESKNQID